MKRVFSHPLTALVTGLCLRLYFVFEFPQTSGDTVLYEEFAANWLKHHLYGMSVGGVLTPIDMRVPGYPAYLALIYFLTGKTGDAARLWVMLGQTAVDLLTCVVIAAIAALLVSFSVSTWKPGRAFRVALWLAATCPFTANYVAVPLTETLAFFFTSLALLLICLLFLRFQGRAFPEIAKRFRLDGGVPFLAALIGLTLGLGTLFRPETPLILAVLWLLAVPLLIIRREFRQCFQFLAISGVACFLPLVPWGIRNAITLHEVQFLAPEYSNLPGEIIPYGFMKWERTWLYRFRDVYLVSWNLNGDAINLQDIPSYAFDSPEEKQRVGAILDEYNQDQTLTHDEDAAFGEIARERTARHPLRTCIQVPALRVLTMWFTPRIELLPFSGKVWPVSEAWDNDPVDFSFTIGFFLLNVAYVVIGVWGGMRLWRARPSVRPVLLFFLAYTVIRTGFLTTLETPEPRYVLECFPILLALAALIFVGRPEPPDYSRLSAPQQVRGES
jgi:hypothetical protein